MYSWNNAFELMISLCHNIWRVKNKGMTKSYRHVHINGQIFVKLIHKIWLKTDLNKFKYILFFIMIILFDKIIFLIVQYLLILLSYYNN